MQRRRAPAGELLRLVVDDDRQLRQAPMASTPCRSGTSPTSRRAASADPCNGNYTTTLVHRQRDGGLGQGGGTEAQGQGRSRSSRPKHQNGIHTWTNTSARARRCRPQNSSDPLKCGASRRQRPLAPTCNDGSGYDYGHWPGQGHGGVGRLRHPRRARVRLADRVRRGRPTSTAASATKRSGRPRCPA